MNWRKKKALLICLGILLFIVLRASRLEMAGQVQFYAILDER